MKTLLLTLLTAVFLNVGSPTPQVKAGKDNAQATYTGYMVDQMCAPAVMKDGGYTAAAEHDKACLIEPPCVKSGYGIFTPDNKWIPFDAAGSRKAANVALTTDRSDHIAVTVHGVVKNGELQVTDIAEAK